MEDEKVGIKMAYNRFRANNLYPFLLDLKLKANKEQKQAKHGRKYIPIEHKPH